MEELPTREPVTKEPPPQLSSQLPRPERDDVELSRHKAEHPRLQPAPLELAVRH